MRRRRLYRRTPRLPFILASFALTAGLAAAPPEPETIVRPSWPSRLTVKFRDELAVRAAAGGLRSEAGAELKGVRDTAARHGLTFEPLIRLPQSKLDFVEARAAARSGLA